MELISCRPSPYPRQHNSGLRIERLKRNVAALGVAAAVAFGGGRAMAADPVTSGNAYGEQLSLKLQTLLASVQASSGPLPTVSGDTPPFNKDASTLSLNVG